MLRSQYARRGTYMRSGLKPQPLSGSNCDFLNILGRGSGSIRKQSGSASGSSGISYEISDVKFHMKFHMKFHLQFRRAFSAPAGAPSWCSSHTAVHGGTFTKVSLQTRVFQLQLKSVGKAAACLKNEAMAEISRRHMKTKCVFPEAIRKPSGSC